MSRATRVLATLALSLSALEVEAQQPIPATSARTVSEQSAGTVGATTPSKNTVSMPTEITPSSASREKIPRSHCSAKRSRTTGVDVAILTRRS